MINTFKYIENHFTHLYLPYFVIIIEPHESEAINILHQILINLPICKCLQLGH